FGGRVERQFDTAKALRSAEGGAVEGVDGVAVIEVADVANARIVVVGAVKVRAAHRPDRDVLEDRKAPELGRGGGDTRVSWGAEEATTVVPQGEGLWQGTMDVHVAVAAFASLPG